MELTVNNIHFLWAAYLVVVIANAGFVMWLKARWSALRRKRDSSLR